jgi:tRNA(Arg) A34 adenosine deaminase TadA
MSGHDHEALMRRAIAVAGRARAHGNHPFGAVLADADGTVLLEAENAVASEHDATRHAELVLMSEASRRFDRETLAQATMYTSCEPCAMCSGSVYWAGVGRVVYGLSETSLAAITGAHPENATAALPCRVVLAAGQREIAVIGPLLEDEARAVHDGFWS